MSFSSSYRNLPAYPSSLQTTWSTPKEPVYNGSRVIDSSLAARPWYRRSPPIDMACWNTWPSMNEDDQIKYLRQYVKSFEVPRYDEREGYLGQNKMTRLEPHTAGKLGILFVEAKWPNEIDYTPIGTAFLVQDSWKEYAIGAGHLLVDRDMGMPVPRSVRLISGGGTRYPEVRYVTRALIHPDWYNHCTQVNDFCIMEIDRPFHWVAPQCFRSMDVTGTEFYIRAHTSGYPGNTKQFMFNGEPQESTGWMQYSGCRGALVRHDCHTERGSSGGPVRLTNREGDIVAIQAYGPSLKGATGRSNGAVPIGWEGNNPDVFIATLQMTPE
ncbi:hypothetical protein QBC38DRAFT_503675 [Podospora fimiseda]|uniref:Serine protease n=1 Tax=Podospora fimiseda TaxID=252190 RepID=A0AAN7BFX4_9PEZI|nr:hypothetical protein QBC38DRAFT_503675 [Podospora fimiseda]